MRTPSTSWSWLISRRLVALAILLPAVSGGMARGGDGGASELPAEAGQEAGQPSDPAAANAAEAADQNGPTVERRKPLEAEPLRLDTVVVTPTGVERDSFSVPYSAE
ncbi:MAG: hypothetical protein JXA90_15320, partial [Planctomycetes bacterium]|nr:hypothetical protein [Planctomycetota bacterium]